MDWNWLIQLLLAVTTVVLKRRNESFSARMTADDQFGDEFSTGQSSQQREPRFASVPPGSPITIGLIYVFPTTVIVLFRKRRLADFTQLGKKKKEGDVVLEEITNTDEFKNATVNNSSSSVLEAIVTPGKPFVKDAEVTTSKDVNIITDSADVKDTSEVDTEEEEEEMVEEARGMFDTWQLDNDILHEEQLLKLDTYFYQLDIESGKCRRRIICELAAAPESFYPMSDIVLRQIKPKVPIKPTKRSRFYQFLEAAKTGFNGDMAACHKLHKCSYGAEEIFDDKMLRFFQLLGRELNIEFVDYD